MAARRGHHEGSIHQRKDGYWTAVVDLGRGPDGKRRRKQYYGKTRREVAEQLKTALHDQQRGIPIITEKQTVEQFLEHWLEEVAKPVLRATTYATYESHIRIHIKPSLGRTQLTELTPQQIQAFLNHKQDTGLAARTVADIHAILRHALHQAVRWNLVARNVATLVDRPRFKQKEMQYLTPEDAKAFLQSVKGDRLEALYTVAIALGLRRGEALGLRWEHVDLDKGILYVRGALQRVGGNLVYAEPKTRTSRRSINLPKVSQAALRAHRVRQVEEQLAAGVKWQKTGYVFTTRVGTPIEPRNFKRSFDQALQHAGLPHMRIHDLRHTAASLMLAQGISPKVISEILGHSRIGVTMDIYAHLMAPARQEAANKMDELLGS